MKRHNKNATPLLVGFQYGKNQICVWCPYCKKFHLHGWDWNQEARNNVEHRGAHCFTDSPLFDGGYYIGEMPLTLLKKLNIKVSILKNDKE